MELKTMQEALSLREVVFDKTVEQPVESETILPDYCPDIVRLLKCEVIPEITSRQLMSERLTVEGSAQIRVLYLTEEGRPCVSQTQLSFTKVVEVRGATDDAIIELEAGSQSILCRVLSPRRLEFRGAIGISIRVSARRDVRIMVGASGGGVQVRTKMIKQTALVGVVQRGFTVKEEFEIPSSAQSAATVLRVNAEATVTDFKAITGKVVVKGEVALRVLYATADGFATTEYLLPVSHIADLGGVDESCRCEVRLGVRRVEMSVLSDLNGDGRGFSATIALDTMVSARRECENVVVADAYSVNYDTECQTEMVHLTRVVQSIADETICRMLFDDPDIQSVIDLWCTPTVISTTIEDGKIVISGKLTCCVVFCDAEGRVNCREYSGEWTHEIPLGGDRPGASFIPVVAVQSETASISGGNLEVRAGLSISGNVFSITEEQVVVGLGVNESSKKTASASALVLYFPDEGEEVWEIAKRYNTSPELIIEENALSGDIIEKRGLLLIPSVG